MHLADQTVFPPLASPPGSTDAMEQDSESVVEPTVHSGKDHQDTREVSRDQEDRSSPDEGEWTDPLLDSLKDEERDPLIVTILTRVLYLRSLGSLRRKLSDLRFTIWSWPRIQWSGDGCHDQDLRESTHLIEVHQLPRGALGSSLYRKSEWSLLRQGSPWMKHWRHKRP